MTFYIVEKKTIGITELHFEKNDKKFLLCDVGGQRNERRKWENSFKDVSVVLYVLSLNDYDLLCYEDDKQTDYQKVLKFLNK